MTFLERFIRDNPNAPMDHDEEGRSYPGVCPWHLGYEKKSNCNGENCVACWHRRMPILRNRHCFNDRKMDLQLGDILHETAEFLARTGSHFHFTYKEGYYTMLVLKDDPSSYIEGGKVD